MKFFQLVLRVCIILVMSFSFTLAQESSNEMLLGDITSEELQKEPFAKWYNESSGPYQVDHSSLEKLEDLMKGVQVKIVMGTWCHDSKREVPRFYKMMTESNIPLIQVEMIAVDRDKKAPNGEIDNMKITNTPTFVFYKNGVELNRIVETPVESIEKDIVKILSGETYLHSKMLK